MRSFSATGFSGTEPPLHFPIEVAVPLPLPPDVGSSVARLGLIGKLITRTVPQAVDAHPLRVCSKDSRKRSIIRVMSTGSTTSRYLTLVLLLGVVLLGARFALSVHPYEHEPGTPVDHCELCEFAHVCSDGAAVLDCCHSSFKAPNVVVADNGAGRPSGANARGLPQPRAPPFLL